MSAGSTARSSEEKRGVKPKAKLPGAYVPRIFTRTCKTKKPVSLRVCGSCVSVSLPGLWFVGLWILVLGQNQVISW